METWQYLRGLLETRPDWRLDQLVAEMQAFTGDRVVPCTVHRAARRLGFTFKQVHSDLILRPQCTAHGLPGRAWDACEQLSIEAAERNDLVRADYMYRMCTTYLASQLVFLDESSVDSRTPNKRRGYSLVGKRARHRAPFIRGDRYTLTALLCSQGILAYDIVHGSSTANNFREFCETTLVQFVSPLGQSPGRRFARIGLTCLCARGLRGACCL